MADPRDAALAYAIWDSENSVKMVHSDDIERHMAQAKSVRYWLEVHGYSLRRKPKRSSVAKSRRNNRE